MTIEEIEDMYINQGMSIRQIAEYFNISKGAVDGYMKKFNIQKRNRLDAVDLRFATIPRKKAEFKPRQKRAQPQKIFNLTDNNWEIKNTKLRADRQNVRCLYVDSVRARNTDKVIFICKESKIEVDKFVSNFLLNPVLISREIGIGKKHKGVKLNLTQEQKDAISLRNSGEKITTYFDFTCPVCGETFKYRNILRNRKKKYCCKECQLTIWVAAGNKDKEENELERDFRTEIEKLGYKVETQKQFGYWPVDCYLPELDIILQVDGIYWHAKPEIYGDYFEKLDEHQQRHVASDKRFAIYCKNKGLKYARVWQDDFRNDPVGEVDKAIKKALGKPSA